MNTTVQSGKIPTSIELTLSYYQVDATTKKLISCAVQFSGYIDPADFENDQYYYTLTLNYESLSHTDLMIAFALPWYVYLTMYILVGILCIVMICLLTFYHKLVSRRKKRDIYLWQYIKYYFPNNFLGLVYAVTPQLLYIIVVGGIFSQHFMTFSLNSLWCDPDDESCNSDLIWDEVFTGKELTPEEKVAMRNSRIGYILIHAGVWIHWRAIQLITLQMKNNESKQDRTSFDLNIWNPTSWKRMNYAALNLLAILLNVFFVYISFSSLFGDNLWWFIVGFKILGEIMESTSEILLEDNLMLSPISTTFDLMEGLCTFGAPDFLEFIASFVLGLGVQFGERTYLESIIDMVGEFVVDKIEALRVWLGILMGEIKKEEVEENDNVEEDENEKEKIDNKLKENLDDPEEEKLSKKSGSSRSLKKEKSIDQSLHSDILLTENSIKEADIDEMGRIALMLHGISGEIQSAKAHEFRLLEQAETSANEFDSIVNNRHL